MATLNRLLIAEATEYEFKSAVEANKPRSLLKTVSAFANGVGGSIYFGVSGDGVAAGLDPEYAVPSFRSTEQSFVVTLRNLNYGKSSMPTGADGGIENGIKNGVEKNTEKILNAIRTNPKITQKRLADETGLSVRTVARELKQP
jgi:predicted HTH transcriptional regulator